MNKFLSRKLLITALAEAIIAALYANNAINGDVAASLSTVIATVFVLIQGQVDREEAKKPK